MPKPRPRSRRWFLPVLVLLSLLGTSVWAVLAPYRPASLPVTVEIGARASLSSIADQLADNPFRDARHRTLRAVVRQIAGMGKEGIDNRSLDQPPQSEVVCMLHHCR